jgi:hypothetical protein
MPFLYNSNDDQDNPVTIYGKLGKYIQMVQGWRTTLNGVVATLPACQTNAETGLLTNAPCTTGTALGSVDANPDEDLNNMYLGLEFLLYSFDSMRASIRNMWNELQSTLQTGDGLAALGGKNPAMYSWTDRRGSQRVVVQIGNFVVPSLGEFNHGNWLSNETCTELFNYSDSPVNRGCSGAACDQAWVRIWRYNQPATSLGPIGSWNPFNRPIVKAASAYYNYRDVGLKNKS